MLSRRQMLLGSPFAGAGAAIGTRSAAAISIETTPRFAAEAFALACKPLSASDHGALVASAQASLKDEIKRGLLPASAQEIVVCPICGCRFIVTADSSQ